MSLALLNHDAATWTAWGTWAYTVFTLALAVGAVVCYDMSGGRWVFPPSGESELLLVQ